MTDLGKAVNGWNQAVGIMRKVRDGLQFTVNEINENKGAFRPDPEKAKKFEDARNAMKLADMYLDAMDRA